MHARRQSEGAGGGEMTSSPPVFAGVMTRHLLNFSKNFVDPDTFYLVSGVGFGYMFILGVEEDEFHRRFANYSGVQLEHKASIERRRSEWVPTSERIVPLLDWCGALGRPWSAEMTGLELKTTTLLFSFEDNRDAVEFMLRYG